MDEARWARIGEIFSSAIAEGPQGAYEVAMRECADDPEVFECLDKILREHFRAACQEHISADGISNLSSTIANRFKVISRLGTGGFGEVYRVSDQQEGGTHLALKILRSSNPDSLHRFKREFKSVAEIIHPNIIRLYELFRFGERWMFTMELVEGVDLLRFISGLRPESRHSGLYRCFSQLAAALRKIHQAKLLHRDLKPSNVLVTGEGRVVVLDFGLVRAFTDTPGSLFTFAGTPEYMAPESANGARLTEATDWYAFGTMLYQALADRLPFEGHFIDILRRKQMELPPAPVQLKSTVPLSLSALCESLLQPDPSQRGGYDDVIRSIPEVVCPKQAESRVDELVGRTELLDDLYKSARELKDCPTLIHLCGPSGVGKTSILRELKTRLGQDSSVLVFAARCYQGETVPYQSLDDLIDHIAQYFRQLPKSTVDMLLPRNFGLLVRIFPVLAPFMSGDVRCTHSLNSFDLRSLALGALREMLGRMNERSQIVLVIDDLQWGDADGCAALKELFESSDSPPILGLLAYRTEDVEDSSALQTLRAAPVPSARVRVTHIKLGELGSGDCQELAEKLLGYAVPTASAERIVQQSGGNPFLIHEIARWLRLSGGNITEQEDFSLTEVVQSRIEQLSADARYCLQLVTAAGQPIELQTLRIAMGTFDIHGVRDQLMSNCLIRSRTIRGQEQIEPYHDRVRTTLLSLLDPQTRIRCHGELAHALRSTAAQDAERIAFHYKEAGDLEQCAIFALTAARRAIDILAFREAARFFEMALSTQTLTDLDQKTAHRECAEAFANAGLGQRAAEHYFDASSRATEHEQLECNLRAAEELLHSGHIDEGLQTFAAVLRDVGLDSNETHGTFLFRLLLRRILLNIHGIRWRERSIADTVRHELLRIDACSSVAIGLALVDVIRGSALQSKSLMLALRAGESCRIARALAMEAGYTSTRGVKAESKAERILVQARSLCAKTQDPRAAGLTAVMSAAVSWNMGKWNESYERARLAREGLQNRRDRATWERDTAAIFEVDGLRWRGSWCQMKQLLPLLLEDARSRGDLYAESILQMHAGSCSELANDNPDGAREGLRILERWSNSGFHVEHLVETHNQVEIALYLGRGEDALTKILRVWPALRKSLLLHVQTLNIQMRSLLARAYVSASMMTNAAEHRRVLLERAREQCRRIQKEGAPWGGALAKIVLANIDLAAGSREAAIMSFQQAEDLCQTAGMHLHQNVVRRCRAQLMQDEAGHRLLEASNHELQREGIICPERFSQVISPVRIM